MKDFLTKKMIKNLIYYALCFLAVVVTPYLAAPIVPLWDWTGYGLLRGLFHEIFTIIFWTIELVAFHIVKRKILDKRVKSVDSAETEETDSVEKPKKQKQQKPLLPVKNVLILFGISILCILIVSIQTGFQVKPIYDIGEKVTGYEIWNKIGWLGKNVAKCVWILLILMCTHEIASEALRSLPQEKQKWLIPVFTGVCLLLFGLYDVLASSNPFAWTYMLFYVAFTAVYYLTDRNVSKTLLLVILIYLF